MTVEVVGHMGVQQVVEFFTVSLAPTSHLLAGFTASCTLTLPGSNTDFDENCTMAGTANRYLHVSLQQYSIVSPTTPAMVIERIKITGTGTSPFGPSNC